MLQVFLVVIGASIGVFVMLWVIVYVLQFIRPDTPIAAHRDAQLIRRIQMKAGKKTAVQFSDIRYLERDQVPVGDYESQYHYLDGSSAGFPDAWIDDLYHRTN
ncbi:MAG: hypothetical protein O3B41_01135 [Bacteroidetes bacterium]|nr:hypothetical protein [Bacteroidota bacterium]